MVLFLIDMNISSVEYTKLFERMQRAEFPGLEGDFLCSPSRIDPVKAVIVGKKAVELDDSTESKIRYLATKLLVHALQKSGVRKSFLQNLVPTFRLSTLLLPAIFNRNITLRPARSSDSSKIEILFSILRSSTSTPTTNGRQLIVATHGARNGEIIGAIYFQRLPKAKDLFIETLSVADGVQGKGYGTIIMAYVIKYAQEHACTDVALDPNENAKPFYEKLGFERKATTSRLRLDLQNQSKVQQFERQLKNRVQPDYEAHTSNRVFS